MDTITKGGVIWDYLKGEVINGKEDITRADLLKVGYSAQAVENAIAEIKKEKLMAKSVMPVSAPTLAPSKVGVPTASVGAAAMAEIPIAFTSTVSVQTPSPMTHPADQDLMNNLSAAIKQDTKIEFETALPAAAPRGAAAQVPAMHQNLAQNLGENLDAIPVMPLDLVHGGTVLPKMPMPVAPKVPLPAPTPVPPVAVAAPASLSPKPALTATIPMPPLPSAQSTLATPSQIVTNVMSKKKHGFLGKVAMVLLVVIILCGIGAGISFGMTGSWLPPVFSSLFEKYPQDKLFNVMLGNLSSIKMFSYVTTLDLKVQPYDSSVPRPPKPVPTNSTTTLPINTSISTGYDMPTDFNIHADLTGSIDIHDSTTLTNENGEVNGSVTGTMGGVSFTSNADLMKVGNTVYIQLNKLPSLGLFDLSKVEGKWIRFDQAVLDELGISDMIEQVGKGKLSAAGGSESALDQALVMEQGYALADMARTANLLTGIFVKSGKVDGQTVSQYRVSLDYDTFISFFTQAKASFATKYGASSILDKADLASLQKPELKAQLDYLFATNTLFVWIDPKNALPVKIEITSKVASPEGTIAGKDQMIVSDAMVVLSEINKPINLVVPTDSISAIEAYAALSGMTLDQYYEQKQVSNVSNIFYALGNFKAAAGVYPMSLKELLMTPVQIRAANPQTAPKKPAVKAGFDFAPWGDAMPILSKVPQDAFSKADYVYTSTKKDFQMKYEIRIASSSPSSIYLPAQFINGINTMTSKAISVEGAAAAKSKKK